MIRCYGTLVTADPVTNLYVIDVYQGYDGSAEITSISVLDLAAYVDAPSEDDPVEEDPTEEECGENDSPTSPETGYADHLSIAVLLIAAAAAVILVSACALRRKHD